MPTLGTIYTYITDRGDARAAICTDVQGSGILTVFLTSGDDQFAMSPYLVVQNVPYDPSGTTPNSYH